MSLCALSHIGFIVPLILFLYWPTQTSCYILQICKQLFIISTVHFRICNLLEFIGPVSSRLNNEKVVILFEFKKDMNVVVFHDVC
jgi:hypothetical protein